MTFDPGTSAVGQLRSHLATSLSSDPAWDLALSRPWPAARRPCIWPC